MDYSEIIQSDSVSVFKELSMSWDISIMKLSKLYAAVEEIPDDESPL